MKTPTGDWHEAVQERQREMACTTHLRMVCDWNCGYGVSSRESCAARSGGSRATERAGVREASSRGRRTSRTGSGSLVTSSCSLVDSCSLIASRGATSVEAAFQPRTLRTRASGMRRGRGRSFFARASGNGSVGRSTSLNTRRERISFRASLRHGSCVNGITTTLIATTGWLEKSALSRSRLSQQIAQSLKKERLRAECDR